MELRIDRNELLKVVKVAIRGVSHKSTIEILRGIKLVAKDGYLYLTSSDLERTIKTKVTCDIIEEGDCVIGDAKLLNDIATKLPDGEVSFKVADNKATIKSDKSKFTLVTENTFDFPNVDNIENGTTFDIDNKILLDGIRKVIVAISNDDSRPTLTGSLLEVKDGVLSLVALDGYRLSYYKKNIESNIDAKAIIPKVAVNELVKLLDDTELTNVTLSEGFASFQLGDTNLTTRLIQGQFFNYKDIIGNEFKTTVTVNTKELQRAVERATILSKDGKNNMLKLTISKDKIVITANSEIGDIVENIEVDKHSGDEEVKIAFNSQFMLEGIKTLSDESVNLYLNGSLNPAIFKGSDSEDEFLYLALPIRVSN